MSKFLMFRHVASGNSFLVVKRGSRMFHGYWIPGGDNTGKDTTQSEFEIEMMLGSVSRGYWEQIEEGEQR